MSLKSSHKRIVHNRENINEYEWVDHYTLHGHSPSEIIDFMDEFDIKEGNDDNFLCSRPKVQNMIRYVKIDHRIISCMTIF